MNTITKALIYESQGLNLDALRIYKEILKVNPDDQEAIKGLKRVSFINEEMLELFYSTKKEDIDKFKRWLVEI
ncbi:MAG: hypothetical protein GXZ15_03400 [Campylobacter sp.]|nr:hypothetical protein [Campylobacter sp.]